MPFMFSNYVQIALRFAGYEITDDAEAYYGEITKLEGVWATGMTLSECQKNLIAAAKDWIQFSIERGYPIPVLGIKSKFE
jgi:predicted RNase H-like HicB family nuclease